MRTILATEIPIGNALLQISLDKGEQGVIQIQCFSHLMPFYTHNYKHYFKNLQVSGSDLPEAIGKEMAKNNLRVNANTSTRFMSSMNTENCLPNLCISSSQRCLCHVSLKSSTKYHNKNCYKTEKISCPDGFFFISTCCKKICRNFFVIFQFIFILNMTGANRGI